MIGFGTRWPLCDRWLGAGLAQPKSPTHTYVGWHHRARTHVHIQEGMRNVYARTDNMRKHVQREFAVFIYTCIFGNNNKKGNREHCIFAKAFKYVSTE